MLNGATSTWGNNGPNLVPKITRAYDRMYIERKTKISPNLARENGERFFGAGFGPFFRFPDVLRCTPEHFCTINIVV